MKEIKKNRTKNRRNLSIFVCSKVNLPSFLKKQDAYPTQTLKWIRPKKTDLFRNQQMPTGIPLYLTLINFTEPKNISFKFQNPLNLKLVKT